MGLTESEASDVYYTALHEHVGCAGFAHEAAAYADELVLGAAAAVANGDDLGDMVNTLIRRTIRGRGRRLTARDQHITIDRWRIIDGPDRM